MFTDWFDGTIRYEREVEFRDDLGHHELHFTRGEACAYTTERAAAIRNIFMCRKMAAKKTLGRKSESARGKYPDPHAKVSPR